MQRIGRYRYAGDHPRIRGEHWSRARYRLYRSRDHPRIRGEHTECNIISMCLSGIIPAYAGSTLSKA